MVCLKSLNPPLKPDKVKVWKRDLRESSLQPFGRWITSFDWSDIFTRNACEDKYGKFNDIMSDVIDILLPLKRTKVTKCDKPWLTSSIKELIIKRQKALHYYGKNSDAYKLWRNQDQQSIKSARFKYYAQSVEKLKTSNPSRWWKEIKSLGGISSKSCWYNQLLSNDVPNCHDLAEVFNCFLSGLTSHFTTLTREEEQLDFNVPGEYLIDANKVYNELRKIKTNKSPGPDMIPNKILKVFAYELSPVITDIYNSSIIQDVFPMNLKRSIVVPIHKVSLPQSVEDDLRHISLTFQISKVMEGFTLTKLFAQMESKLDTKQFVLPGKSTTHALTYLLHTILSALENTSCSARLFFADFKKGFDLVHHNIIICELKNLGVHPAIVRWIKAFLSNLEQCVRIENSYSSWKKTNGGLPQGTKLGPLLFAVLVNSLLMDWPGRVKFVDDTTVLEIIP
ncbi:Hypothetical predicted protein [Paramuricea clavata]|uniref:Uncharacterized protein n=1 Tax=Paramuricea clavata TaxID=317549 RepID=A0A6S7GJX5_PARCT|nr:Hypothetical predicted protein [Paramuricea clavata]